MRFNLKLPFLNRVSLKDRVFFTRQMATLIDSGIALVQALRILYDQVSNKRLKALISEIITDLEGGYTFSTAIQKHPDVFSKVFVAVVKSGEASGRLDEILKQMANQLENEQQLTSKIRAALVYPAFIFLAMIGVGFLMMTRVVPTLATIFAESNAELPFATKLLIATSNFLVHFWWIALIAIVALVVGLRYFFRSQPGQSAYARILLFSPVFGSINQGMYMTRFTRTLAMLVRSGVPIVEAIRIVSGVMNNKLYSDVLEDVAAQLERGIPMSVPLGKSQYIPPIVSQMVAVGEQTGKLDSVMENLTKYYDTETDTKIKGIASLIEPIVIVILGVGVAFIVFAILMPIYRIAQIQ